MSEKIEALRKKLTEIFQLDQTDLDFGIYRIMNQKAEEITDFMNNRLLSQVSESFSQFKSDGQSAIQLELDKLIDTLKQAGMNPEDSPKVQDLKSKLAGAVDIAAVENEVFSHLTSFFSRYYEGGDFLSLRRYKKDVYAIPYEGEEVKLHWANADQYYIKSSENFRDYSFKLDNGKTVHFKLIEAETERDNNKTQADKERRFILINDDPLIIENDELYIRFQYIADENKLTQVKHNEQAIQTVSSLIPKAEFAGFLGLLQLKPTEKNKKRTLLEKYLNEYTSKYSFDYFIHKDLGGFLRRELDFYIKNEVLFLDDLDEDNIKFSLSKAKTIKAIANKFIDFLEQLENFQKKIWLKKKFVVDSGYCLTIDNVPEDMYPEVIANTKQIEEWESLFTISEINGDMLTISGNILLSDKEDKQKKIDFLKQNPFLVLDTKYFDQEFTQKLLASITDLDEKTNGLLINADNFHALNLLQEKYKEKIKCTYIDPPYNTAASEIIYKNNYKNSSWLTFINSRLTMLSSFGLSRSPLMIAIDEYQLVELTMMLDNQYGKTNRELIVINHHPQGGKGKHIAYTHEYMLCYIPENTSAFVKKITEAGIEERSFMRSGTAESNFRQYRPNSFYAFIVDSQTSSIIGIEQPPEKEEPYDKEKTNDGFIRIYPLSRDGQERVWRNSYETCLEHISNKKIICKNNRTIYQIINNEDKSNAIFSNWTDSKFNAGPNGTNLLRDLLGEQNIFSYPKSIYTVEESLRISDGSNQNQPILDFFAGSGTTGHAVINLNREDAGKRKFILVEMGAYFDTVTKPRIQKVIYSENWKNGKPLSRKGSSHIFKYIRLESYEDALNNLKPKDTKQAQLALKSADPYVQDQYMLSYKLDFEYKDSLINLGMFEHPFDYQMNISNGTETKLVKVNLIETFNYLIGLYVKSVYNINDFQIIEGMSRKEEKVLVIWRDIKEKDNKTLDDLFKKLRVNPKDFEFDRIYVNGDNNLENLKLDKENWKVTLIEEEFKRRMFEVEDV